jgi:uncharacterized protein (DUF2336 family)
MTQTASLIDDLERTLATGTNQQRIETLSRITDLFVAGASSYSDDHIALFDDVLLKIATRIEAKALARLSTRLAPIANAPVRSIKALAMHDDIAVARPVLSQSPRLDDADLLAAARAKGQSHLLAISERALLSEAVTDVLVEHGDREVVHSVARNKGARFSDAGFRTLINRSSGDDALATHVGMRRDLPRPHMIKLIEKASVAVREKLMVANPQAAAAVKEIVAEVTGGMADEVRNASPDYAAAKAKVLAIHRDARLDEAELYNFARARMFEETAVALSVMAAVPIDAVERALLDDRTEIVLILAKVAGLSWTTAKAILLIQAGDRGISVQDLDRAMNNFTKLQPDSARRVLSFYNSRRKTGADSAAANG